MAGYNENDKHILKLVEEWARCWNTPGLAERMVDEIYADSTEVFTPLQKAYYVKKGKSKENWKNVELEAEKLYQKRQMKIVKSVVSGNTVALEAATTFKFIDGNTTSGWFAAFLEFDKDGKVISDHTYMPGPPPGKGVYPPGLKEAMDKIAASQ